MALAAAGAQAQQPDTGKLLYAAHCASCHGDNGTGDGWLAAYLTRRPSDLTMLAREFGGTYPREIVRHVVDGRRPIDVHGPRDMPAWGDRFGNTVGGRVNGEPAIQRRIDALVRYIATLQK